MPDQQEVMQLHSNAIFYLVAQRIRRFIPFVIVLFIIHFVNSTNPGSVKVNGHPATPANMAFLSLLSHAAVFLIFAVIIVMCVYCVFLARSYSIEIRKEGVALRYGVINLNSELLLFAKIQDIMVNRSLLERML